MSGLRAFQSAFEVFFACNHGKGMFTRLRSQVPGRIFPGGAVLKCLTFVNRARLGLFGGLVQVLRG